MNALGSSDADSLIPVVRFGFPPQRGFVIENNIVSYKYPQYAMSRSQDLEPMYHDCGQFYIIKKDAFLSELKMVAKKAIPFIIPETEVQDIDNDIDWEIAEVKYKLFHKEK